MSGPEFFQTRMGQIFFEGTMPRLYRAVQALTEAIVTAKVEYRTLPRRTLGPLMAEDLNDLAAEGFILKDASGPYLILERRVKTEASE